MAQEQLKDNLLNPGQWLRMLLMLGYLFVLWVVGLVLLVVMITQSVTVLITGFTNANLKHFGIVVNIYLFQIVDYLVHASDEKPFPFKPLPDTRVVPPGAAPGIGGSCATGNEPAARPYADPVAGSTATATPSTTSAASVAPAAATAPPAPDPLQTPEPPYKPPTPYPDASEPVPDPYADLDTDPDSLGKSSEDSIRRDMDNDETKRI